MTRHHLWLLLLVLTCALGGRYLARPPAVASVRATPSHSPSPRANAPQLIVTHLQYQEPDLRVHVQNQGGPGQEGSVELALGCKAGRGRVFVQMPTGPLETAVSGSINVADLGLKPDEFVEVFEVKTPAGRDFFQQIDYRQGKLSTRPPFKPTQGALPDLVIDTVYYDGPHYLKVKYHNAGAGTTGADFLIRLRCGEKEFAGNHFYRFPVPEPGVACETGGFTIGLLGLKSGDKATVVAEIDPEGRVLESERDNNTWQGEVDLSP